MGSSSEKVLLDRLPNKRKPCADDEGGRLVIITSKVAVPYSCSLIGGSLLCSSHINLVWFCGGVEV